LQVVIKRFILACFEVRWVTLSTGVMCIECWHFHSLEACCWASCFSHAWSQSFELQF